MTLEEFITSNDVDYTKNLIKKSDLKSFERAVGVTIGKQLADYLLTYGYLGYKHIEFYGVNSNQMHKSDMITQTLYLHEYFPKTKGYIALENSGDGNYVLVSDNDYVYDYSSEEDNITNSSMKLFDYILERFQII